MKCAYFYGLSVVVNCNDNESRFCEPVTTAKMFRNMEWGWHDTEIVICAVNLQTSIKLPVPVYVSLEFTPETYITARCDHC